MLSPQWFYSYFALNDFLDCKVYVSVARKDKDRFLISGDLFFWEPFFTPSENYNHIDAIKSTDGLMHAWVLAEKGQNSTFDKTPMQLHFMDDNSVDWRKSHKDFCSTDRPILRKTKNSKYVLPFLSDHYEYLGSF